MTGRRGLCIVQQHEGILFRVSHDAVVAIHVGGCGSVRRDGAGALDGCRRCGSWLVTGARPVYDHDSRAGAAFAAVHGAGFWPMVVPPPRGV